jgi:hypothetical protein
MKLHSLNVIFERPEEKAHRTKHHAKRRITFDGCVKVSYGKFGNLLADIKKSTTWR